MGRFVGRAQELDLLRVQLGRSRRDHAVVAAVIEGDSGIGKTRLVAEALRRSEADTVVSLTAYEAESPLPFTVGRELLAALARSCARAGEITRPLLSGDPEYERPQAALMEAAHRSLALVEPLVLSVDDLHWCDKESLALLHYLVRGARIDGYSLGLVVTARPSPRVSSFATSLHALLGGDLVRLRLEPLDRESSMALAAAVDPPSDEARLEDLWRRSGGIPFWIELLATSRHEEGVDLMVAERLRGVGADAALLLGTLAILGRPLLRGEAEAIQGWAPARVEQAANELCSTGLVGHQGGSLRLSHDLVREAVDRQIGDLERRHVHGRLATWLEADPSDEPLHLLAALEHRRQAGTGVRHTVMRILRAPGSRVLGSEGVERVLAAIDAQPDQDDDHLLQRGAAELADDVGLHDRACERWTRLADRVPTTLERARALLAASVATQALERGDQAKQFLARARATGAEDLALEIALDVSEASILRWIDHRPEAARALTVRALERAREEAAADGIDVMSPQIRRAYLRALALEFADAQQSRPRDMLPLADEIARVATGFDARAVAECHLRSGIALLFGPRPVDGERRLETAWTESLRAFLPDLAVDAGNWLVRARYALGRLADAEEVAAECEALAARAGMLTRPVLQARVMRHVVEISRYAPGPPLDALRALAAIESDTHYRLEIHEKIAISLARLNPDRAAGETRERLRAARADAASAGCDRCRGELLLVGADAFARIGDATEAAAWYRDWDTGNGIPSPRSLLALRAQASLAMATGHEAEPLLERTIAVARKLEQQLEEVWARLDLAALMMPSTKSDGVAALHAARTLAMSIGALTEQRLAEQQLRAAGVRTWRRQPSAAGVDALDRLSEREREIARLVAAGATNPEIADTLYLSRKTVERHLSNVFTKLGVRNRTELAARMAAASEGHPS